MAVIAFFSLLLLLLLSAHGVLGFVFGAATSAYQGKWWTTNSTGDVAADGYHKYKALKQINQLYAPTSIPTDPEGLQLVLQYLKEVYGDLPLYIQETGAASSNDTVHDTDRVEYLKSYIGSTLTALRNGVLVKGYFACAFMDVFEFLSGYQSRYGLYRVDFEDEARPRQARFSACWYSGFLKKNGIHVQSELDDAGSHAQQ